LKWFTGVEHVEIGFNQLRNPERILRFPLTMETLILESNDITSIDVLNNFSAPKSLPPQLVLTVVFESYLLRITRSRM